MTTMVKKTNFSKLKFDGVNFQTFDIFMGTRTNTKVAFILMSHINFQMLMKVKPVVMLDNYSFTHYGDLYRTTLHQIDQCFLPASDNLTILCQVCWINTTNLLTTDLF